MACSGCARQYDAGELDPGARLRCRCGRVLEVPEAAGHDAAVVRCSSCGASRQEGTASCAFCGADFTLHEQDLDTICPSCFARISDRARYCHHCGVAILPEPAAGSATDLVCPACGGDRCLRSRPLGEPPIAVAECRRCGGLWLGAEPFEVLLDRARATAAGTGLRPARTTNPLADTVAAYRRCPVCSQLMHRRNWGRKSGVVVDSCSRDGVWFDADELEAILRWVRTGGELRARRLENEEQIGRERRERLTREIEPVDTGDWRSGGGRSSLDALGDVLAALFDLAGWG